MKIEILWLSTGFVVGQLCMRYKILSNVHRVQTIEGTYKVIWALKYYELFQEINKDPIACGNLTDKK